MDINTCFFSASANTVMGMLLGRFSVGIGLGLGPAVAALYITEVQQLSCFVNYHNHTSYVFSAQFYLSFPCLFKQVSPTFVRGTYGSFIQIATCFGLMGALLIGIPVKDIPGW